MATQHQTPRTRAPSTPTRLHEATWTRAPIDGASLLSADLIGEVIDAAELSDYEYGRRADATWTRVLMDGARR